MSKIILLTENELVKDKFKNALQKNNIELVFVESISDITYNKNFDICIVDYNCIENLTILKSIKSRFENVQIIIFCSNIEINQDYSSIINAYIFDFYNENLIYSIINASLKAKYNLDMLSEKNKNLANSLYRLNVLYNTSSQIAGTLDIDELISYMIDGLYRALSFDLSCTLSFKNEQSPVLIINSLYDVSDELMNELKERAIKNYYSLFENENSSSYIKVENLSIVKNIKNSNQKLGFDILEYDNLYATIDSENKFFGCIEIFKNKTFSTDDATYFQTIIKQISLPLKSAVLYNQIIDKNTQLEKLQRIKSEFISIVSHELRTPLTPIKNALSILSSGRCGDLSANAMKFIDMAKRNVENLATIINDILDINKIEAGKMDFNYNLMNIHTVVESIKNSFDYVAKEKGIIFKVEEQLDLPDIYADSQRIGQVLSNLVSNAMKFTNKGKHVTISTQLVDSSNIICNKHFENELKKLSGKYILVKVMDEGIGINENNLLKVFDKFTQIENSLSRKVGGTGLGLTIARQLIIAHKGVIWCDSIENKGSSFNFVIPISTIQAESKTIQKTLV